MFNEQGQYVKVEFENDLKDIYKSFSRQAPIQSIKYNRIKIQDAIEGVKSGKYKESEEFKLDIDPLKQVSEDVASKVNAAPVAPCFMHSECGKRVKCKTNAELKAVISVFKLKKPVQGKESEKVKIAEALKMVEAAKAKKPTKSADPIEAAKQKAENAEKSAIKAKEKADKALIVAENAKGTDKEQEKLLAAEKAAEASQKSLEKAEKLKKAYCELAGITLEPEIKPESTQEESNASDQAGSQEEETEGDTGSPADALKAAEEASDNTGAFNPPE